MSFPESNCFDALLPASNQSVRIASVFDAQVFMRRWVIRDKDRSLKKLLRCMERANSSAALESAILQFKAALASRGLLILTHG